MRRVFIILFLPVLFVQGCTAQTNALFTAAAQTHAAGTVTSAPPTVTLVAPTMSPSATTARATGTRIVLATRIPATPATTRTKVSGGNLSTSTPTTVTAPIGLGATELKYRLLAEFGAPFFCDPDVYPVARVLGPEEIEKRVGEIQKNTEEYEAILRHNNLQGVIRPNPQQQEVIYAEHKKLSAIRLIPTGAAYQFSLRLGAQGAGTTVQGTVDRTGAITVTSRQASVNSCPICLAGETRIDTPGGAIAVRDLRAGMAVWTVNASGERQVGFVVATGKRSVPVPHPMVHLVLDDGRELYASALHPTVEGRTIGDLVPGDRVDGARVTSATTVAYDEDATFDILPSGETSFYWANGILIASTLKKD